jgi:transcriptional regulator with GAF, ATPase, and Fis domain
MKAGAVDFLPKPFSLDHLMTVINKALEIRTLRAENRELRAELGQRYEFDNIVGRSDAMREIFATVERVAPTRATVLMCGESGVGKDLIARAIHHHSPRDGHPFVKINCTALPENLMESELFGYEKGAFTGANTTKPGKFEQADTGTALLDEIGDVPASIQVKLLRVLQEREFERLGSTRTLRTDARLIAATNRDLKALVDEQKFRSDLYYRLNVFPIRVPPLRERREDIPLLVRHFVQQFSRRNNRVINTIPSETMQALVHYHWPGNIRELQNVIERAVIISKGTMLNVPLAGLQPDAVPKASQASTKATAPDPKGLQGILDETERTEILRALEASNGVLAGPSGAAARLGMKRTTLQLRMQKLGIRMARTALTHVEGTPG